MRPRSCEFQKETIAMALNRADYKCERCGIPKEETFEGYLEIHHLLGIADAVRYYPEISHALIASLKNARVLCCKCHKIEDKESRVFHGEMARRLQHREPNKLLQRKVSRIA